MTQIPIETERKFLIAMPDVELLSAQNGARVKHIEQTYLICENGKNARVRKILESDTVSFIKTVKQRISTLSSYEDENEISESEYIKELTCADPDKKTVIKTRYCIPYGNHTVEIDVYPFWNDKAIIEIEQCEEDYEIIFPDFVKVRREVTEDEAYKNLTLAKI